MTYRVEILDFVERLSGLMPDYIITQLKEEPVINLVSQIIAESGKNPGDALIIFVTAVKYLWGRRNAFTEMEEKDSFQEFVRVNRDSLVELAAGKRMQANIPTRALPLIEVINKKIKGQPVAVIELGASYGLLGWTLLEIAKIIETRDRYLPPEQKIPSNPRPIDYYLGIELEIPGKEWFLACLLDPATESYLTNFINGIPHESEKFNLIQASAFGFSDLEPVKRLTAQSYTLVVLTSFIFFQIGIKGERKLKNEILKFNRDTGSYWISQFLKHPPNSTDTRYYIEWNQARLIESSDSICSDWKWLTD